jgi:predicted O-methyltransferase YrrM
MLEKLWPFDESGREAINFASIDADKADYPTYYESSVNLLPPAGLTAPDNTPFFNRVTDFDSTGSRHRSHLRTQDVTARRGESSISPSCRRPTASP